MFHQESFQEEDYDDYTRELYQNQEEYDREYWQHEDLLIVTKEIVMDRLEEYIDEEGDYEQILSGYY